MARSALFQEVELRADVTKSCAAASRHQLGCKSLLRFFFLLPIPPFPESPASLVRLCLFDYSDQV